MRIMDAEEEESFRKAFSGLKLHDVSTTTIPPRSHCLMGEVLVELFKVWVCVYVWVPRKVTSM